MHGMPKHNIDSPHLDYVNPDAPKNGHIKMAALKGTYDTLNPFTLKGTAAQGLNLVYDRLMARRWNEPFTMYPLIAKTVEMPADRSAVRFTLNEKATFSDGSPITTDDVIFSYETLKEKGRPNMRRIYKLITSVEKESDHALTFTFGEGHDRETVMILSLMPILSKNYWKERDFEETLLTPPVTNGPYTIETVDPGRSITYKRNPDYWAKDLFANIGHYNFDQVTYEYFRDSNIALEAFNKGDLNYRVESDISKWISAYADKEEIIKYEAPHMRPVKARGFIFNTRRKPFDDVTVRHALEEAFDEDWIGQNIYYGKEKRTKGFFTNSELAAHIPPDDKFTQRAKLKRAATALKDAGWDVVNGIRMKDGQPLEFELILSTPKDEKIALNYKKHLERIGIQMSIRVLDTASFQKRRGDYDYDMILHHWQNSLSPGTEQMLYWTCESKDTPGQFNYAGICDPEIDTLTKQIADAQDYAQLTALARNLDQKLQNKVLFIPLFYSDVDHIAHYKNLQHPENTPIYGSTVETWWMFEDKE